MTDDTAIRAAAQRYIDGHGWEIIVLHGVAPGENGALRCRCGRGDCMSAGKHPMGAGRAGDGWRAPVKDPAQIPDGANIGLQTGQGSGVFALDVDPKNGGDVRLRELIEEHGDLPPTWWQRTGSGGTHFVFEMPADFTPTNSRGRLPVGLDIRGQGGQIVLAPSVSAVGPYEQLADAPVLPGPAWLLEMIRPLPPIEIPPGMESAYMPQAPTDRGQAYAAAAVRAELSALEQATPGERNQTAFNVACRLIELARASWSGLTEEDAAGEFVRFGHAIVDATFTERELWACWRSAARKVGYGEAVLPARPGGTPQFHEWGELGGPPGMPPFSGSGSPSATGAPAPAPAGTSDPFDPFADAGVVAAALYPPYAAGNDLVTTSVTSGDQSGHTAPHLRDFLLRRSQLSRLPRPVPLIQGILWRDTDAWLIGESGSGKSFIGLDWAAHVASGRPWNNRRVWPGPVIWVVAEGASGVQQRVDAWELVYGPVSDDLIVLPVAVQAALRSGRALSLSPQWRQLMEVGAEVKPALILLDTQARMTRGLNENDNDEMGQWLEAVSVLRRASGNPCNLVVHHTGSGSQRARGATAIDGAQDVEWRAERVGARSEMRGRIVLDKSKDGADGVAYPFAMKVHKLGWDPEAEEYVTSLTVSYDPFDQPERDRPQHELATASATQGEILHVLREVCLPDGETQPRLLMKVNELRRERADRFSLPYEAMKRSTLTRALSRTDRKDGGLLERGLVVRNGEKWADQDRYEHWQNGDYEFQNGN